MILIATEDEISEAASVKLINKTCDHSLKLRCVGKKGNGFLRQNLGKYLKTAELFPVFLLTDLDRLQCASFLKSEWLQNRLCPHRMMFRIAVREIESWLLADRDNFARYIGVSQGKILQNPDSLDDPKEHILNLAAKGSRDIRQDLLPKRGAVASRGLGYNARLCDFVNNFWAPEQAETCSDSLMRARRRISECIESYRERMA